MSIHTLAEERYPHEMTFIFYYLHEHKHQAGSRVTKWPSAVANLCHTLQHYPELIIKEPGHMPFLNQQSMPTHPLHTPMISQRFVSE